MVESHSAAHGGWNGARPKVFTVTIDFAMTGMNSVRSKTDWFDQIGVETDGVFDNPDIPCVILGVERGDEIEEIVFSDPSDVEALLRMVTTACAAYRDEAGLTGP